MNFNLELNKEIKIVYNGGSQPGTIRNIIITSIENDDIKAICLITSKNKQFKLDKFEIYDQEKHKNHKDYEPGKKGEQSFTFEDLLTNNYQKIKELGYLINQENKKFAFHTTFKNGKIKVKPEILLEYSEYVYEELFNPLTGDSFENKRENTRPWSLRIKNKPTKTFKHIDKALLSLDEYFKI